MWYGHVQLYDIQAVLKIRGGISCAKLSSKPFIVGLNLTFLMVIGLD